jgi:hypothetical protein
VRTLQWLRDTAAILFAALLALGFMVPLAVLAGVVVPSSQPLLTVGVASALEAVARQLRRAVGEP